MHRFFGAAGLFIALICWHGQARAATLKSLPETDPKYRSVKQVYDKVAQAFGSLRPPPRLAVVPNRPDATQVVAQFIPASDVMDPGGRSGGSRREGCIAIDERVVDILGELGASRDDGLALLLGHELTHYYFKHSSLSEFGRGFAGSADKRQASLSAGIEAATGKPLSAEEKDRMHPAIEQAFRQGKRFDAESEADLFGGFYGYLAGYETPGVAARVYDLIYTRYPLEQKDLSDYPDLASRKELAARAELQLRELLVAFRTANRLLVVGRYREAARLVEYVAEVFPSCEINNNAGVAWAREALRLAGNRVKFAYPFSFDRESRLGGRVKGTRGGAEVDYLPLLDRAEACFERARAQNPNYATAYVNLAAVSQLKGEPDLAAAFAGKGERLAAAAGESAVTAAACVVRGIAFAGSGDNVRGAEEFRRALEKGSLLAGDDLDVLEGKAPLPVKGREIEANENESDRVDGQEIGDRAESLADFDSPPLLLERSFEAPELMVRHKQREHSESVSLVADGMPGTDGVTVQLHATGKGYGGSLRGVKVGDAQAAVSAKFGRPTRVASSRQGEYLVYERSGVAFELDAAGKVAGWMVYGVTTAGD